MITRTIRMTKTWDITVPADYGDTEESLVAKAIELSKTDKSSYIEYDALTHLMPEEQ